jgi:ClpA/ClpB-like protein
VIFWALHYSRLSQSPYIEPEHILEGLLKEDPQLFRIIMPDKPGLVNELRARLAATRPSGVSITEKRDIPLSPPGKAVVVAAAFEQDRLGHPQIANQHLLLALLIAPAPSSSWFGKRKEWPVQALLSSYGITAQLVESKTREGIITPATWILDDAVIALNGQLSTLADLLVAKNLFTRSEFVSLLDKCEGPLPSETFLLPLFDALEEKGVLTPAEQDHIRSTSLDTKGNAPQSETDGGQEFS